MAFYPGRAIKRIETKEYACAEGDLFLRVCMSDCAETQCLANEDNTKKKMTMELVQDGTLLEKISELRQAGILVVVTSQCSHGRCDMTIYEVGQAALRCGAICSSVISKEALFSKLMWLLPIACNASQLSSLLDRDFCGELGSAEIDRGVT